MRFPKVEEIGIYVAYTFLATGTGRDMELLPREGDGQRDKGPETDAGAKAQSEAWLGWSGDVGPARVSVKCYRCERDTKAYLVDPWFYEFLCWNCVQVILAQWLLSEKKARAA